jgi:FG-GAP-like repeat
MKLTPRRVCNFLLPLFLLTCLSTTAARAANNPVPLINTPLVPTSVTPGGAGFTLTVNGTGFVSGAKINWNGTTLTTTFVSASQLTATVPAINIATAGSASVTVTNPAPGGGTSLPAFLRIATTVATPSFVNYSQNISFNAGAFSLITGDFNGDGKSDLAFIGDQQGPQISPSMPGLHSYSICVELGNGDGSFQTAVCQPAFSGQEESAVFIVAGDFNRDGKLDLAASNSGVSAGSISVFLGNGDGTLQPPVNSSPGGNGPFSSAVGDFNQDGKLDLVVVTGDTPSATDFVSVLLGNGDGTFQTPVTYASGLGIESLVVGDFNRDGKLDVVVQPKTFDGNSSSTLYFLAGNGDGTFQSPVSAQTVGGDETISVAADFNGDGKLDLFLTNNASLTDDILLGNGDGTFQSPVGYPFTTAFSICNAGVVDDLNADGKLDLAFCSGDATVAGSVGFHLGNGDGTFQAAANILTFASPIPYPTSIVAGDFRGDGRVDLAISTRAGGSEPFSIFLQGNFPVATASPSNLTFFPQDPNTTSPAQVVTLTNTGTMPVTFSGASIAGTNAASFGQTNTCGSSLAGGATCNINVTFTPTTPGQPSAILNINDSAIGTPQVVYLAGTTNGPAVALSPSSITFASQYVGTTGLPQSVTLTNTGSTALAITNVATSPSDFAPLNSCGSSLAAGASCAIGVFFDPTVGGARTGTLTIADNAAGGTQTVPLSGTGQDFSVAAGASASATVSAGQTANYSVAVAPAGGFAQSLTLSCSGAPAMSTCSVSPGSIALNGTAPQTAMVTVTTAGSASLPPMDSDWPSSLHRWQVPLALSTIAALLILFALNLVGLASSQRERRFRWAPACALALLVCLVMTLTSCGGGSSSRGTTGTQAGTYTITVTGNFTSGSTTLTHNAKLTLVVH